MHSMSPESRQKNEAIWRAIDSWAKAHSLQVSDYRSPAIDDRPEDETDKALIQSVLLIPGVVSARAVRLEEQDFTWGSDVEPPPFSERAIEVLAGDVPYCGFYDRY
jgi:hypothetical protein